MARTLFADPTCDGVALLDLYRILSLGRTRVVDEHDRGIDLHSELANQAAVGLDASENPTAAVDVENDWQPRGGAAWLEDEDRNVTGLGTDGHPCLVDFGHLNQPRLRGIGRFTSLVNWQLAEGRLFGDERDQIGRRLLQVVSVRGNLV